MKNACVPPPRPSENSSELSLLEYILILFFIICLFAISKETSLIGIGLIAWHSVFFFLGYHLLKIKRSCNKFAIFLTVICFTLTIWGDRAKITIIQILYRYSLSLCGIAVSFAICIFIQHKMHVIAHFLSFLGQKSAEIYILQGFFFNIFNTSSSIINTVINFLLGLIIPIVISVYFRNGKIIKILFGR